MIFLEKLKLTDVARLALTRQTALYGVKSLGARFAGTVLERLGLQVRAQRIDFGELEAATGIRGNAYRAAEAALERLPGERWALALAPALGIDFWLIVRKYFFDELYLRFEFIEMALRYATEHRDEAHAIRVDPEYLGDYAGPLSRHFALRYAGNASVLGVGTLLLLPLFVEYFWRRKGLSGELRLDNQVVCEVDGDKTLEMFSSLFAGEASDRLAFVVERRNATGFNEAHKVAVLGLRREGLSFLRRTVWTYLFRSVEHLSEIARFGSRLFRIFYVIMLGRADAISGSGNLYCTYEHLITTKAVRNEFLKAAGNKTVFVPMNAHVTPQYFHSEIFVNYDVMCAAGPHIETLYRRRRALTRLYPRTGSYESHRGATGLEDRARRVARLEAFKGESVAVTIISPGMADATLGIEVKLMRLARALSKIRGVKVLVRLKPVPLPAKYASFYAQHTAGCENILLTGAEYELFDFCDLSDLVVTSISNAAFDLAQAGAQAMFIDYLKDPELQLCLSAVPGVLLSEEESLSTIEDWILDRDQARHKWKEKMKDFSAHISYRHRDFESYRRNFRAQISGVRANHPPPFLIAKAA